jgi:hypothetical protein
MKRNRLQVQSLAIDKNGKVIINDNNIVKSYVDGVENNFRYTSFLISNKTLTVI